MGLSPTKLRFSFAWLNTLEIYDAMAEAERTGVPYQTRLDPPPADPRVAHAQMP
jgi:hypothetical protein